MTEIPRKLNIPDWEFRVVIGRTRIDYDPDKEDENRRKHGYSLESGAHFLEQILLLRPAMSPCLTTEGYEEHDEVRHMHMCLDDSGKIMLIITTMRPNETVRVISYRPASTKEREQYYLHTGGITHPN